MKFIITLIISILVLAFSLIGISIKVLFKKNGKFSGTCSSYQILCEKQIKICGFCKKKSNFFHH